jgi:hypothetical protein
MAKTPRDDRVRVSALLRLETHDASTPESERALGAGEAGGAEKAPLRGVIEREQCSFMQLVQPADGEGELNQVNLLARPGPAGSEVPDRVVGRTLLVSLRVCIYMSQLSYGATASILAQSTTGYRLFG